MNCPRADHNLDGIPVTRLESDHLRLDVAPSVGGRVISLVHKPSGHEFLWHNRALPLRCEPAGSEYDPNFYGGIDELLPNDIPELIDGVNCPDHGELWTTPLAVQSEDRPKLLAQGTPELSPHPRSRLRSPSYGGQAGHPRPLGGGEGRGEGAIGASGIPEVHAEGERLVLSGDLPRFGLHYERAISLRKDGPRLDLAYRITNRASQPRSFLWKLHAALAVQAGDIIDCPARRAQVVDLAWSRCRTLEPFDWPILQGQAVNLVPPADGTVDFFYLFDLRAGRMAWRRPGAGLEFAYEFDPQVFRFAWLFASYGGFNRHYTVVLEPCTAMPMSVNEAAAKGQCSRLEPGQTLATRVTLRAGPPAFPVP